MPLVLLMLVADSLLIPVTPAETLQVTVQGAGEPVVLIPGLMGSAPAFRLLMAELEAAGFRSVVIEPLGVGRSGRPAGADYSLNAQADRVAAVIDSLDLGPSLVVAHSMGAAIAFRLAYRRPELVRALVSLEGGPAESAATAGVRSAAKLAPLVKLLGAGAVRGRVKRGLVKASGDPSWVTDSVVKVYTDPITRDLGAALRAFGRIASARDAELLAPHLAEIQCPVLLVLGLAPHPEALSAEAIDRLGSAVRRFTIERLPGAGHHLQEEQPARIAGLIRTVDRETRGAVALGVEPPPA